MPKQVPLWYEAVKDLRNLDKKKWTFTRLEQAFGKRNVWWAYYSDLRKLHDQDMHRNRLEREPDEYLQRRKEAHQRLKARRKTDPEYRAAYNKRQRDNARLRRAHRKMEKLNEVGSA